MALPFDATRSRVVAPQPPRAFGKGLVLVGTSTGGPPALEALLGPLPKDFPWPILVAQHMPASFTGSLARRLDRTLRNPRGGSHAAGAAGARLRLHRPRRRRPDRLPARRRPRGAVRAGARRLSLAPQRRSSGPNGHGTSSAGPAYRHTDDRYGKRRGRRDDAAPLARWKDDRGSRGDRRRLGYARRIGAGRRRRLDSCRFTKIAEELRQLAPADASGPQQL